MILFTVLFEFNLITNALNSDPSTCNDSVLLGGATTQHWKRWAV